MRDCYSNLRLLGVIWALLGQFEELLWQFQGLLGQFNIQNVSVSLIEYVSQLTGTLSDMI